VPAPTLPAEAVAFQQPCGACHATAEPAPPNFLAGDAKRIGSSLAHCAPRMFVRLAMWDTKADARDKVPMPPPQAVRAGHPWMQDMPADAIKPLRNAVAGWLRTETGEAPDLAKMLSRGYENLRPCLPAGA
jgi:mono/diheme cytochrome c family protein